MNLQFGLLMASPEGAHPRWHADMACWSWLSARGLAWALGLRYQLLSVGCWGFFKAGQLSSKSECLWKTSWKTLKSHDITYAPQ